MLPLRQLLSILILAVLCLPLIGCFEDPVQEHVHLNLRNQGPAVVTIIQKIAPSDRAQQNEELADRLDEARYSVANGLDPWSRRLALESPLAERKTIETISGEARRVIQSAVFENFATAVRLLETDGLTGSIGSDRGTIEIQLFPTGGSRATATQQQEAQRRLREWSTVLAEYFETTADLYLYLDDHPNRAALFFARIFESFGGEDVDRLMDRDEEELVNRAISSLEMVADALLVPSDAAFSLNELTRLAYDPFPARLTVTVEGQVLESTGFIDGGGFFERPSVDAWNALRSLEGRWISPDLVTAVMSPAPDDRQPRPDAAVFATLARRWSSPPSADEIEAALVTELRPEELLQLRWRTPLRPGESMRSTTDWLPVLSDAEASVPD